MSTTAPKPATTPIPVQLSEPEFEAFILPHLSMPKRGPSANWAIIASLILIMGTLHGDAMEELAHTTRRPRPAGHPLYDHLQSLCQMGG